MNEIKHKWTVSIIAQYDRTDTLVKAAYEELEESMCCQKENTNINYIIFQYDQQINTVFIKQPNYSKGKPIIEVLEEIQITDFYDGSDLLCFFNKHVKKTVDSDHGYMVITFGHGTGFGLFPHEEKSTDLSLLLEKQKLNPRQETFLKILHTRDFLMAQLPLEDTFFDVEKFAMDFRDVLDTEIKELRVTTPKKILKLKTFKEVLSKSIGYVDVLITMNCYMQMLETGYYLKDIINIMISPQTTISFWGFNYKKLFESLNNSNGLTAEEISKNVCIYFIQKYYEEPLRTIISQRNEEVILPEKVAFSANRLQKYTEVKNFLQKIIITLNANIKNFVSLTIADKAILACIVKNARDRCVELTKGKFVMGVVDIKTLLDNFGLEIFSGDFKKDFESDFSDFSGAWDIIAAHQPGKLFETKIAVNKLPIQGPQGISIFFPSTTEQMQLLQYLRDEFDYGQIIEMPEWNLFLDNYINIPRLC